ncbi:hypothetical protein PRZ48_007540 [Zasmidium cellare]|uniref:NADP-dependent oxidoreductase domain-containing protein n=1 Tax=Zasmidium cellare TaxID=395010 RepID=A0ABR0EKC4_ZASCE|nr:hypothetical protein PRZ48_007540 [Zasmidium cellare]
MAPTVIFGDIRGLDYKELEPVLHKYGITRLDSAAVYQAGVSETTLGEEHAGERFTIDTKILTGRPRDGTLTPEKIEESSKKSLERLGMSKVNVLYTHAPDAATPVKQQARGFDDVHKKGRFSEEWLDVAKAEGYIKPTWFQGQYNLALRTYEEALFPLLRKEGYDRPAMYEYYDNILDLSEKANLSTGEVSLRWIVHHSALQDDDILILGASRISQLEQSLDSIKKGPLDEKLAEDLNALWTPALQKATLDIID